MEKLKTKIICDHCKGNGYLRINSSSYTEVHQCPTCKSQGEIEVDVVNNKTTVKDLKDLLNDVNKSIPYKAIP
ncbi:hypothetical protein N9W19_00660 [bacterium]|nr:hypothetical protein [bacterium]|tara:strand:+ start:735 stop:953 length:219 start_codon:yes stop_codon:yes gene_type:complete